jgi:hypothetical protein
MANRVHFSKYTNGTHDPAKLNLPAQCATGYVNTSLLCSGCSPGYSSTATKRCSKCPEQAANTVTAFFGALFAFFFLLFYIRAAVKKRKGQHKSAVSGAKSIGLSFVQVLSLLGTFPVAWPEFFLSLFQVSGTVAQLGEHFVNLKCMYPDQSEADVFWITRIVWSVLPFVLCVCAVAVWCGMNLFKGVENIRVKIRVTVVTILYIIWPGLCTQTFLMFACRSLCDREVFGPSALLCKGTK